MSEIEKKWYVLRAISGKETKVKEYLEADIKNSDLGDYVSQVLIPTEKVYQVRNGKKIVKERSYLPGYVLVEAALVGDRCGMPDVPTSLSKEEGLELIANERRIELAAEGFRSDDMYRYSDEYWNKHINNVEIAAPDGDNIITMSWNPRMHLRPIPQTAIDLNPLLADDQNPGY